LGKLKRRPMGEKKEKREATEGEERNFPEQQPGLNQAGKGEKNSNSSRKKVGHIKRKKSRFANQGWSTRKKGIMSWGFESKKVNLNKTGKKGKKMERIHASA